MGYFLALLSSLFLALYAILEMILSDFIYTFIVNKRTPIKKENFKKYSLTFLSLFSIILLCFLWRFPINI